MALPRTLLLIALIAPVACRPSGTPDPRSPNMAESPDVPPLVPTLRVRVAGDTVTLELTVANGGREPVVLTYGTSQRYDFAVRDAAGAEVWRWSADRMFAQSVTEEAVPAGGTVEYREVWVAAGRGVYRVVASLTATDHPVELEAEFEVAGA